MPSPLDTAHGTLSRDSAIGSRLALLAAGVLLAVLGLAISQGRSPEPVLAAERSGGLGVSGKPQVEDAVCLTRCVAVRKATVGSKVRVSGEYLDQVDGVVFTGAEGVVRARFDKRGYGAVTTTVPKGATSGTVFLVAADGTRSNPTPRELKVLPASMIPEEVFPVRGRVNFGSSGARFGAPRSGYSHQGQDVMAACGTRMVAIRRSKVVYNTYHGAAGWYVVLRNLGTNTSFAYMHLLEKSPLAVGSIVGAGQRIGRVGQTGRAYGCHLHFEFWQGPWQTGGRPIDPLPYLRSLLDK